MCLGEFGIWWLGHGRQELYLHISSAQRSHDGCPHGRVEFRRSREESVGAGRLQNQGGPKLDLLLQLLMVATPIFITYRSEARTQQEQAQDCLSGRMLHGVSGPWVLCISYFMVPLRMEGLCKAAGGGAASGSGRVCLLLPRVPWHRNNVHAPWEEWWLPAWLLYSVAMVPAPGLHDLPGIVESS